MIHARASAFLVLFVAIAAPSAPRAQTCAVERLASPVGAVENEFGWAIEQDGSRILVTAAEEFAADPTTGAAWGDDGGFYVVDALPGGGFGVPQRHQWSDSSAFELGRWAAFEGPHVVLGDAWFPSGVPLYPFTDNGSGFAAEAELAIPSAGVWHNSLDLAIEGGRLVVLGVERVSLVEHMVLKTFERVGGAWSLTSTFDLGLSGPVLSALDGSIALEGPFAYAAFSTGELRRAVWNGTGWIDGGTTVATTPGAPFGALLDVDAGRIVTVGSDGAGGRALHAFFEIGAAPLPEPILALPASTVDPESISIRSNRVAIGYPDEESKRGRVELAVSPGPLFVGWQHDGTLHAAVNEPGEFYGQSVELTPDGRLLVGAPHAADYGFVDRGYVEVVDLQGAGCAGLMVHPSSVSLSGFSTPVDLALVGPPSAANELYVVLLASSAASPGIPLGSVFLPLANDQLLLVSFAQANKVVLKETLGTLDADGGTGAPQIQAQLMGPGTAGLSVAVAWVAYTLSGGSLGFVSASEARTLSFLP